MRAGAFVRWLDVGATSSFIAMGLGIIAVAPTEAAVQLVEPSPAAMLRLDAFAQCLAKTYPVEMHKFLAAPQSTETARAFRAFIAARRACPYTAPGPDNFVYYTGAAARFYLRQARFKLMGRNIARSVNSTGYICIMQKAPRMVDRILASTPGTASYEQAFHDVQPIVDLCIADPQARPTRYLAGAGLSVFTYRFAGLR